MTVKNASQESSFYSRAVLLQFRGSDPESPAKVMIKAREEHKPATQSRSFVSVSNIEAYNVGVDSSSLKPVSSKPESHQTSDLAPPPGVFLPHKVAKVDLDVEVPPASSDNLWKDLGREVEDDVLDKVLEGLWTPSSTWQHSVGGSDFAKIDPLAAPTFPLDNPFWPGLPYETYAHFLTEQYMAASSMLDAQWWMMQQMQQRLQMLPVDPHSSVNPHHKPPKHGQKSADPRRATTVMLRNIPNRFTREMVVERLNLTFRGKFDFLYLPIDFANKCNIGYAFINFRDTASCREFMAAFHGVESKECLPGCNSAKVCEVSYARVQGKEENVANLLSSPVLSELQDHEDWKPMLFDVNGEVLPFPQLKRAAVNEVKKTPTIPKESAKEKVGFPDDARQISAASTSASGFPQSSYNRQISASTSASDGSSRQADPSAPTSFMHSDERQTSQQRGSGLDSSPSPSEKSSDRQPKSQQHESDSQAAAFSPSSLRFVQICPEEFQELEAHLAAACTAVKNEEMSRRKLALLRSQMSQKVPVYESKESQTMTTDTKIESSEAQETPSSTFCPSSLRFAPIPTSANTVLGLNALVAAAVDAQAAAHKQKVVRLRSQIESCISPEGLSNEELLRSSMDEDGFISCSVLGQVPNVQKLLEPMDAADGLSLIREALSDSSVVDLDREGDRVRTKC